MPKLGIATSKTHSRPHFAGHTQSSLMKKRTPMKLKKSSSTKNINGLKKSQESVVLKLNGIYKRRSSVMKQSRSMQMLIMILKQQRDRRATIFFPDSELTKATCQLENSLVSFQSDLIKDVSRNLKEYAGSPAKLATLRGEPTKVNESEFFSAEGLHASSQDRNCAGRDNSKDIRDSSEDRTIVNVSYKLELHSSDKEKTMDSRCEVEDLHRRTESEEKSNDFSNKDCFEIDTQIHPQSVNIETTNRKRTRKTWTYRKVETRNEHVNVNVCHTDLQGSKSTKFTKHVDNRRNNMSANDRPVVNSDATIRKRGALQKNLPSNQRTWRPPGVPKTWTTESAMSLRPISQKSSQSAEKSIVSIKNKLSSTEHIESFNSESTSSSISSNQSKMLMKENRDPANRMTKICEQNLAGAKQRQRLQSGGTLPKKRWLRTKIDSRVSDKRDDTNSTLSKSKSRHCQTRLIMPKESSNNSNNIKQHRTESTLIYSRSRTLEVIHTLRKIIDNVRENEDAKENIMKNDSFDHKKNDNEIQIAPTTDTLQNNELSIFAEDVNLNEGDRPSRKSISTQTELNSPSYHKIDTENDQDLEEILKLTRIVATQTSPSCNKNVVEIGCNTSNIVCNEVEVSCDLIGSTNLKTEIDLTTVKDKSPSDVLIHTEPSSVEHIEINVENENTNGNKKLLLNRCKTTLNTEMNLKLQDCDSVKKIPAKMTNNAAEEAEKIMHEKICQISLKSSKNSDAKLNVNIDKNQELIKRFNNHNVNSSINNLFLERSRSSNYDYDASCSSEEVAEYLENDVQYKDMVTSELKIEDIPSDVIAAFELAAERARNLHEAVIIYHKNLMSRESGKRHEETIEDYETSKFRNKQNCLGKYASFINHENEDKIKFECEAMCHFANNDEDFGGFSTCSSRGSSSDLVCGSEFPRSSRDDLFGEKESTVLSRSEQAIARSMLNERSDLEDVKSLMQLLMHRTQKKYALELLQLERNDESFETERMKNDKTLALSAAIKRTSIISRENLVPLVYCIICTVVFWYLQFSFRCDSTK